jgi:O-antigen ligase
MVDGLIPSLGDLKILWRSDRRALLHELLLLFLPLGLLIAPEPVWSDLFYVLILPLALHVAWVNRGAIRLGAMPLYLMIGNALILLFLASLVWDETAHAKPAFLRIWAWDGICTLAFVNALADALRSGAAYRLRLVRLLVIALAINAAISFARAPFVPSSWSGDVLRMGGWAETRHPILGAVMIGILVLLAVWRALETKDWRYWAAAAIGLIFIALTGSRGPALAVTVALVAQIGIGRPRTFFVLAALAAIGVALIAVTDFAWLSAAIRDQLARGDSHRFAIWQMSWQDIAQRFWLGHGPAARIDRPGEDFPHNLFLSTWLYVGAVGVALLAAYFVCVLVQALRAAALHDRMLNVALLIHVLLSAMTDFGQAIKGPGPMWYMLWLATLFAAANGAAASRRSTA